LRSADSPARKRVPPREREWSDSSVSAHGACRQSEIFGQNVSPDFCPAAWALREKRGDFAQGLETTSCSWPPAGRHANPLRLGPWICATWISATRSQTAAVGRPNS